MYNAILFICMFESQLIEYTESWVMNISNGFAGLQISGEERYIRKTK